MSNFYGGFTDSFMGRGMDIGIFDEVTKSSKVAYGEDKIHNSIYMILSTRIGERVFMPEFGSNLHKVLFEPNDLIAEDLIRIYTEEALSRWEKRIIVRGIDIRGISEGNTVSVMIYYTFRNSNIDGMYIYPFNLRPDGFSGLYPIGESESFE